MELVKERLKHERINQGKRYRKYYSGLKGQLIPAQGNALGKKRYVFSALKGQLNITQGKIFKIEVDSEIPAN